MKDNSKRLLLTGMALLVMAACTKELPYKEEEKKFEDMSRGLIDTKAEHLYTASTGEISRTSSSAIPFALDENRRVKFEWTKTSLRVLETERDSRYADNKVNNKVVLEIPVKYLDYHCAKDAYGECTNKEEERSDIPWDKKAFFVPKFESAKSVGLSFLPILGDKTWGDRCHDEVSAQVRDFKLDKDSLNISIERTFQVDPACVEFAGDSSISGAGSVSAVYHYSITKLDSVLSKDFKPVSYPEFDSGIFGFFATERSPKGADNVSTESGKTVLMNHWNPNRTELVYYLSDEFNKPQNKLVKELTYKTVENLNEGLEEAGVKFRIKLNDPAGKNPGDNRNSMIVLVEDPVASGLLGYGPQVEDPVTGEIISARTVMFLGTMKSAISRTYEEIREEKRRLNAAGGKEPQTSGGKGEPAEEETGDGGLIIENGLKARVKLAKFNTGKLKLKKKGASIAPISPVKAPVGKDLVGQANVQKLIAEVKNYKARKNDMFNSQISNPREAHLAHYRYLHQAKSCALGEGTEGFTSGLSDRMLRLVADDAKPWHQLSDQEKAAMIDALLPVMWIPTLIHEMGHNLGLRHNFQASEDFANFYNEKELAARGIDQRTPFTSVMEYAEDTIALPKLGKYDIAALRFGYRREVEVLEEKSGQFQTIPVEGSLSQMVKSEKITEVALKPYGYCTDEHAGINAGCRRFDLGTSLTEIIKNAIGDHEKEYKLVNFRRDRGDFSLIGDIAHARRQHGRFVNMRLMQEVYGRLAARIPASNPLWEQNAFLKDLKEASTLAGQFLMSVVATPDVHCVISEAATPERIIGVEPLANFDDSALSCFEEGLLNPQYVAIGQFGKHFQAKKDPKSENNFADQIDIRGYWIDKLMATRVLFNRSLKNSILDKEMDTYADRADFQEELKALLSDLILNQSGGPQKVELASGEIVELNLPVDSFSTSVIKKPLFPALARILEIPDNHTNFNQLLAFEAATQMTLGEFKGSGAGFADSLKVNRLRSTDSGGTQAGMVEVKIGADRLVASQENTVAYEALERRRHVSALEKVERPELVKILETRQANANAVAPGSASEEIRFAYKMPLEILQAYLEGSFQRAEFYENLVNLLPNYGSDTDVKIAIDLRIRED